MRRRLTGETAVVLVRQRAAELITHYGWRPDKGSGRYPYRDGPMPIMVALSLAMNELVGTIWEPESTHARILLNDLVREDLHAELGDIGTLEHWEARRGRTHADVLAALRGEHR